MIKLIKPIKYLIMIERARHRDANEIEGEWHHVDMASLAGKDSEIVKLTYAEHYEAHKLLALANPTCEEANYAWWMMCITTADAQGKRDYEVTSEDYAEARRRFVESISGENNWHWNGGWTTDPELLVLYRMQRYQNNHDEWLANQIQYYHDNRDERNNYQIDRYSTIKEHFINGEIEFKPKTRYRPVRRVGFAEEFFSACDAAWLLPGLTMDFQGGQIRDSARAYSEGKTQTCCGFQFEFVPEEEQLGIEYYKTNTPFYFSILK